MATYILLQNSLIPRICRVDYIPLLIFIPQAILLRNALAVPHLVPHHRADTLFQITVDKGAQVMPSVAGYGRRAVLLLPLVVNNQYRGVKVALAELSDKLLVHLLPAAPDKPRVLLIMHRKLFKPAAGYRTVPEAGLL